MYLQKKTLDQVYGKEANLINNLLYEIENSIVLNQDKKSEQLRIELKQLLAKKNIQKLLIKMVSDKYAANRAIAADAIFRLWEAWKFIPYINDSQYDNDVAAYCLSLNWTIPLVKQLLFDRASVPIECAIFAVREMDHASADDILYFRRQYKSLVTHKSRRVRLEAVRQLPNIFPTDENALALMPAECLDALITAAYDSDEDVRNWACFILWNTVSNLNDKVEKAFRDALVREDTKSEVYIEAVTGLARMNVDDRLEHLINSAIISGQAGAGWYDAANMAHTADCLDVLIDEYARMLSRENDMHLINHLEGILDFWNE